MGSNPPTANRLVEILTEDHLHTVETMYGLETKLETPLLQQLEDSIESSITGGGTSSSQSKGSVVNFDTTVLIQSIVADINQLMGECPPGPMAGPLGYSIANLKLPLRIRVSMLAAGWLTEDNTPVIVPVFERWIREIRTHLDPPKPPLPIRGVECPSCERTYTRFTVDGTPTRKAALHYHYDQSVVQCGACGSSFDLEQFKGLHLSQTGTMIEGT